MDALSYKTVSANKSTVTKKWYVVDAEGQTLGRFSSHVAKIIRGKHKADFTPHVDCGDNVIVINAEKIRLTGNKWNDKEYITYSGYPGGQSIIDARHLVERKPIALVHEAVKGMLPKNRLGRQIIKNLHVYAGNEHPHSAQQPVELKF